MADLYNQFDEFKAMLQRCNIPYVDLGMQTLIVRPNDGNQLNIRQYHHDGLCLSSWVDIDQFKEKVQLLLKEG